MADVKHAPKPRTNEGEGQRKEAARRAPAILRKGTGGPFGLVHRFAEEMDRLFEDFGLRTGLHVPSAFTRGHELLRREAGLVSAEWSPQVDVLEREGQFVVRADLPGLSRDDVQVELTDELLTIKGERKHETKEHREGYRYNECNYGSFYRAIPLPEGAETSKATAEFRNGVLEIAIPAPWHPEQKPRRLEVRDAK